MARPTQVNTDMIPMATGAKGMNPRSAGNVMPGPSAMSPPGGGMSGAVGGIQGIPARNGAPPMGQGQPFNTMGAPKQNSPVTSGTMSPKGLAGASRGKETWGHARTLGAIAHLRSLPGGNHPHLDGLHSKATAGLQSMKSKKADSNTVKFGSLGGPSGVAGTSSPSMMSPSGPMGMTRLPDEM
jgi:hypothetical protein